jgi:hypothetical protein
MPTLPFVLFVSFVVQFCRRLRRDRACRIALPASAIAFAAEVRMLCIIKRGLDGG